MSKVVGIKEKLHSPIYDAFFVEPKRKFTDAMTDSRMIRFFVDVQNKTRLETNLQASGVLPSLNTFEARAMRVVVSSFQRLGDDETPVNRSEAELMADLIFNSVTTLIVGEKIMIQMPTYFFPGGAGVLSATSTVSSNGVPDPAGTFRFAEPVRIEPQQNFRVEMLFPQGVPGQAAPDESRRLAGALGPIRIWVVLDGYLTRDVQ